MRPLLTIFILTISQNIVFACSCYPIGPLKNQNSADVVFTGKVVEVKELISQEKVTWTDALIEYKRYEYVFEIKAIHKGKNYQKSKRISLITTSEEADCGINFELNSKYLIYAYQHQNKLGTAFEDLKAEKPFMTTDLCTRTRKIKALTFLEQLLLELT